MKIAKLELENVKRVRAVTLEPKLTGLTVIGGRNGQGKTSILDAIAWALGGEKFRPSSPSRDDSVLPPRLEVHLDNGIVVIREGKNSALKVIDPTGQRAGQQLLDQFVEKLALDLPRFMSAPPKEKAKILLQVIGMEREVAALDQAEEEAYNRRRAIGQIADQKQKYARELPEYPEAPEEAVSVSELIARQQEILRRNAENQQHRRNLQGLKANQELLRSKKESLLERIAALQEELSGVEGSLQTLTERIAVGQQEVSRLQDASTEALEADIRNAEEINRKVRANLDKQKALDDAEACAQQYAALSQEIEDIRHKRADLLAAAPLPLPELSVEQGELRYRGKAWDCMSASDQIRVSAAIVRAVNPQCRFILLDKLEQLDLETLNEFGHWLEQEGLQAICTRVSTGSECEIIISDGVAQEQAVPSGQQAVSPPAAFSISTVPARSPAAHMAADSRPFMEPSDQRSWKAGEF